MQITKVFISHAAEDESSAMKLKAQLETSQIKCWLFERDLCYGSDIFSAVKKAIAESCFLIVYLSKHSLESKWIQWELGYAVELQTLGQGSKRPIILPVHSFEEIDNHQELVIQPLKFETNEPIGSPIPFHRRRGHKLSDNVEGLLKSLIPQTTMIKDPHGDHKILLDNLFPLWETLFPDEADRPSRMDVEQWLFLSNNNVNIRGWLGFLLVSHIEDEVIGFAFLSYSFNCSHAYGTFLGISKTWRNTNIGLRWFKEQILCELKNIYPKCEGVYFDVAPLNNKLIEDWEQNINFDKSIDEVLEQAQRLSRIFLFTVNNGYILAGKDSIPVEIIQPCLKEPLIRQNERPHYLMYLPLANNTVPTFNKEFVEMYYDNFLAGFGPDGANIPEYVDHLSNIKSRQLDAIPNGAKFQKMYFNQTMKKLHKEIKVSL